MLVIGRSALLLSLLLGSEARGTDEWPPWGMSSSLFRPQSAAEPDRLTSTARATLIGYIRAYQVVISHL